MFVVITSEDESKRYLLSFYVFTLRKSDVDIFFSLGASRKSVSLLGNLSIAQ